MPAQRLIFPVLAALAGVALLSLMDALMKEASLAIGAYSAALLRAAIAAMLIAPVWLIREGRVPPAPVLRLHLLRGTVSAFMALTFFYALTKLPVAETIAISFIAPIIALYLAAVYLGENISRAAIFASLLGFAGTLVIVGGRLRSAQADANTITGVIAILFSACLYAGNFIIVRKQALVSSPAEATTFHSSVSALVLGCAAPWLLLLPAAPVLSTIAQASILTVSGALFITWAYARAETQKLIPLEYSGFLWATLFGWLFFREQVSITTIIGTVLIVAGCWVAARAKTSPPPTEQTAL